MIKIEFSLAVALYIVFTTCLVFIFWMIAEKKKIQGTIALEKRFFWQCAICTYVYVDSTHDTLSKCPRCGSYNTKEETAGSEEVSVG